MPEYQTTARHFAAAERGTGVGTNPRPLDRVGTILVGCPFHAPGCTRKRQKVAEPNICATSLAPGRRLERWNVAGACGSDGFTGLPTPTLTNAQIRRKVHYVAMSPVAVRGFLRWRTRHVAASRFAPGTSGWDFLFLAARSVGPPRRLASAGANRPSSCMANALKPTLTTRPELRQLMASEFHEDGRNAFYPSEPDNYLKRLHPNQLKLLNSAKNQHLTGFLTFGDGCIDRLMAADFCDISSSQVAAPGGPPNARLATMADNVRPNASLALFYKTAKTLELVFYTRFFVVSYRISRAARQDCAGLATDPNPNQRKQQIFQSMYRGMYTLSGTPKDPSFFPVSSLDARNKYRLVIQSVRIESLADRAFGRSTGTTSYVPYMVLQKCYGDKWAVPTWMKDPSSNKASVIHGIVNTKGCWMLLRNYLWNWPDENTGNSFNHFVTCFLAFRAGDSNYIRYVPRYLARHYRPGSSALDFILDHRNHAYHEFTRVFAGMHYNCHKDYVRFRPERTFTVVAPTSGLPANTAQRFKTNLLEGVDEFWKGEQLWFTSGALRDQQREITRYEGNSRVITVTPSFARAPANGDGFILQNAFTPQPAQPQWGPNVFGQTFGFGKSWVDVFLFKRTREFTRDRGDRRTFE